MSYPPAIAALEPRYTSWEDATGVTPTTYALSRRNIKGKNASIVCNDKRNFLKLIEIDI